MWVIKLGGSLLGSQELSQWLSLIAKHGDGKVVIVPGGGVFADAVRQAQLETNIADSLAHKMAVMAMDQFGVLMTGLNADIVTASSELELAERGWQHLGIVWLPSKMVCTDDSIPMCWDVTSDSLAAWLASKINAYQLLIIKSSSMPAEFGINEPVPVESLIHKGIVDARFGDFVANKPFNTWILNRQDYTAFNEGFSDEKLATVGMRVCW